MVFAPLRESHEPFAVLLDVIRAKAARTDAENVKLGCALNNLMQEMSPLDTRFKRRLNAVLTSSIPFRSRATGRFHLVDPPSGRVFSLISLTQGDRP